MNKKIIIGIIFIILIIMVGGYFLLNKDVKTNAPTETKEPLEEIQVGNHETNSLVVYFSLPETTNPNNMSEEEENSAIVVDGEVLGNVQYMAKVISEQTNSDLYRIEPRTPYTTNHSDLVAIAQEEQNKNVRPEIKNKISNFNEYETIYIGYPIWWSDMPQIMYTFLGLYDFSGKNVYIFSSHGGSGIAGTDITIKNKLKDALVHTNFLSISRNSMETTPNEVREWLQNLE